MENVENVEEVNTEEKENTEEVNLEEEIDLTETLKQEIEKLEEQVKTLKNDYAKAYADTENMRKRLNADFELSKKYRIQSFAIDILPVIDNLERALEQEVSDVDYKKGIEMIYQQLMNSLVKEGVSKMDALDKPFDANFHQAIMSEKVDGVESGIVIQVFQNGYMLKDRILRAAMVKVSE